MKKDKIVVGLVQINERKEGMARSGHQRDSKNNVIQEVATYPYSVGLLQANAEKNFSVEDGLEFILPIYKRQPVEEIVEHLAQADVVGISIYVWNFNLSMEVARQLRIANPNTLIVFGGPHVPDNAEEFLQEYPFVDLACHGEGEQVFLSILENFHSKDWSETGSISYFDTDGSFKTNPRVKRLKELDEFPSPYLSGTFDPLREANPETSWIMLWETNRGCPFSCTYCDWGSAVGAKVNKFGDQRLYRELEWFAKTGGDIIFCCDANFGMLKRDYELAEFAVLIKKIYKHPRILTVQNTKNATEKSYKVQKLLYTSKLNPVVTLSVQSINDNTLNAIKRKNISLETFKELQRRFTQDKVLTYTDVILGMPGETYDSYFDGISTIIDEGQHHRILFYNLSILPNAEMGDVEYQQKYELKIVPQLIQNMHTHIYEIEECEEFIDTVVATSTMKEADWVKSKCVWWITEMLYFNYILKLPIVLLRNKYDISYRALLEAFIDADGTKYPVIHELLNLMKEKAIDIQNGGKEFYPSEDWLGIFWTTEQYAYIDLVVNEKIEAFYSEAEKLLTETVERLNGSCDHEFVHQACELNNKMMVNPNRKGPHHVQVSWNLLEAFNAITSGEPVVIKNQEDLLQINHEEIDFEDWLEHQIVCQNTKFKQWQLPELLVENPTPEIAE